jgi:hypothetical protein
MTNDLAWLWSVLPTRDLGGFVGFHRETGNRRDVEEIDIGVEEGCK